MPTFFFFILISLSGFISPAYSDTIDETDIDIKTREISKTLRCTVCQTENIWVSGAPLAKQMQAIVRERVEQGQSAEEIRFYFLSRYGDYILMEPPKEGINWIIWLAPFLLLFGGGFLLIGIIRGWSSHKPTPPAEPPAPLDEESRRRIERELQS